MNDRPRMASESVPLLRVVKQVRGHDSELKRLLVLVHIRMTLCEYRPRRGSAGLDTNDILHDPDGFGDVTVHVRLVALADHDLDLMREDRSYSATL
jgi:hypothetical protein